MEKFFTLQSELDAPLKTHASQTGELIALIWVFLIDCTWLLSNSYQNDAYECVKSDL